ncbi:GNAT family N-acetyltransferase [Streptomyces sp. NPDC090052]|uniref:GNAT family N-acetyltransferase n=1 Tax=unclassified Streptomyces TaxID=2593676 RepID=UPI00225A23FE|nr:GNAT family N-acetyltransferase [Streptomyces sp. NBC_01306]MCX4725283.1 GNAT family N-acetyltransferase [Streptomyces sp. NBC_01306]WSX43383.1 GNAT family N-acetyltransferase [Streptomyces sp. NBC_00963]
MPSPLDELPIRRLTIGDLTSCADLSENRGWPRDDHKWGLLLAAGTGYGIDAPGGKGLATACVVTAYGSGLAAIGMLLVADEYARQGAGARMMRHVIAEYDGTPLTLHATELGRPLYEKLGFRAVGRAEMVRGRFRPRGPAPAVATRPATAGDLPAMLRIDHEVFGEDRTHMITRLPAFADQLRVVEDTDGITGYAAAWPSTDSQVVGPLIARDTASAQALIASLAAGTDRPLRADIDVRHAELLDWAKAGGMESASFNTVMTREIPDLPGDWTRRFTPLTVAAG